MSNCNNIIDGEDGDDEGDYAAQDGNDHNDDDGALDGENDNDDAGDPWQQYMAAQMAVGGGYSPHMYSHRWAIASILTTTTNTTIITSTNTTTITNIQIYIYHHRQGNNILIAGLILLCSCSPDRGSGVRKNSLV